MQVILDQRAAVYYPRPSAWPAREESVRVERRADESDGQLLQALADAVKKWEASRRFDDGGPALSS